MTDSIPNPPLLQYIQKMCLQCFGTGKIEQGPVDGDCSGCGGTGVREIVEVVAPKQEPPSDPEPGGFYGRAAARLTQERDELREKLAAAEKRIAELKARRYCPRCSEDLHAVDALLDKDDQ